MKRKYHVLLLYMNIGPYHIARIHELEKHLESLTVVEVAGSQKKYAWISTRDPLSCKIETILPESLEDLSFLDLLGKVSAILEAESPDIVVLPGYSSALLIEAASWARRRGVPCVMMGDSTLEDRKRYGLIEKLKEAWIRTHYSSMFLSGIRSYEYYKALGFPESRIWRGVDVVDNDYWIEVSSAARERENDHRRELGLPQRFFLAVVRLANEKNIDSMISAYSFYRRRGGDWGLVIAGGGPEQDRLQAMVAAESIDGVVFAGWVQYNLLPVYYALASCCILPSKSEPWGLVINEAMACGLPVLVSRRCGCHPELCWKGINGYDFDPMDVAEMMSAMSRISADEERLREMGQASRIIVSSHTTITWTRSLLDCLDSTMEWSRSR